MKIFISEVERQNARSVALRNLARFFNIKNWELKKNETLFNDLSKLRNKDAIIIMKLLKEYFKAYDEWFSFYQTKKKIEEKRNKEYELNEKELLELSDLIEKRENSLNALQEMFDEIQVKTFNLQNFGKDISGIIINK